MNRLLRRWTSVKEGEEAVALPPGPFVRARWGLAQRLAAAGVLGAGGLMSLFHGDYAKVGEVTAWVYAFGMIVILVAPDTNKNRLRD